MVLRPLPFSTFREVAELGLVVEIWCTKCKGSRRIDPADPRWTGRGFAGARFACTRPSCGGPGVCSIEPAECIPTGSSIKRAFLMCVSCVPPWCDVRLDQPLWSAVRLGPRNSSAAPTAAVPSAGIGRVRRASLSPKTIAPD
jgi:hypothetical protein